MYIPDSGHKNAENIYTHIHKMVWFDGSLNHNEISKWYNNTKPKGWNHIHWRQRLSGGINHVFRNGNYFKQIIQMFLQINQEMEMI